MSKGYSACAARHLRRHRAGRRLGARRPGHAATAQATTRLFAPTVPLSRLIFRNADPVLQDRHCLPRLAQRLPGSFRDDRRRTRRCARSPISPASSGLADQAGLSARSAARRKAHARAQCALWRGLSRHAHACRQARSLRHQHRDLRLPDTDRRDDRGDRASRLWRHRALAARGRGWRCRHIARQIRDAGLAGHRLLPLELHPGRDAVSSSAPISKTTSAPFAMPRRSAPYPSSWWSAALPEGSKDLAAARAQVEEATAELLELGREMGVRIALEPLHPVYAADRSCLNTIAQALDICDRLDPNPRGQPMARRLPRCLSHLVGSRTRPIRSRAPASASRASMSATGWCRTRDPAQRPRHDGRWRHRHPCDPARRRGRGL